jgi:tyrosine-protein phosphatase YwqE
VATDAHNLSKRPPRVAAARTALREIAGDEVEVALTHRNPLAVLENRPLEYEPDPARERQGGFFTRLRSFLGR